ncbi:MAG: class I SAM-dependent methyltransferase [Defluviitaleaceae bacterium]|nr:class I SAM-dependent methyltransferase [Defluviitaleaceae bacterium]
MNENTYSSGKEQSWRDRAEYTARMKIYDALAKHVPLDELSSIVDVGATADDKKDSSNFFEKTYPFPSRITALSNQDALWMAQKWPGLKFVQGDARSMPFGDETFDLAFSSAVIEHVGSRANQAAFIRECVRVSKKYIFITTPNRYYPVELHTVLPIIHWLPPRVFRGILKLLGKSFFALEENLNLLSKKDIAAIMDTIQGVRYKVDTIRFLGFKSNILLTIVRD